MNPGMMQCCPVGNIGSRPLVNPAAIGPARFRSFHDNLFTARCPSPDTIGSVQQFPRPMNACAAQPGIPVQPVCRPICRPVRSQPVCSQPVCDCQRRYRVPKAPVFATPWRLPWTWASFPKFGSLLPKRTVSDQHCFQRWLPVVNDGLASPQCGEAGCGETVVPPLEAPCQFSNESCGEDIPYWGMTSEPMSRLSPVPATPVEAKVRYFSPSSQQQAVPKPTPKKTKSETYYFSPPPAARQQPVDPVIPQAINPPHGQGDISPASKPAMPRAINPFEDIENSAPNASLPIEANMPQAILLIPKNIYPPLHIPSLKVVSVAAATKRTTPCISHVSAQTAEVAQSSESVEIDWMQPIDTQQVIRQVSAGSGAVNEQPQWEAIELDQAFFSMEQPTRTYQNSSSATTMGNRQIQRHTVIRRAAVQEAEEFVPIRRVITRRRQ